ncbi:MAG: hypothetical protein QW228_05610 [Candidatus Aenigmatarchaeota archaeon]
MASQIIYEAYADKKETVSFVYHIEENAFYVVKTVDGKVIENRCITTYIEDIIEGEYKNKKIQVRLKNGETVDIDRDKFLDFISRCCEAREDFIRANNYLVPREIRVNGQNLRVYTLAFRVPREDFDKIKRYFRKYYYYDKELLREVEIWGERDYEDALVSIWAIPEEYVEKVERLLGIKDELRVEYRQKFERIKKEIAGEIEKIKTELKHMHKEREKLIEEIRDRVEKFVNKPAGAIELKDIAKDAIEIIIDNWTVYGSGHSIYIKNGEVWSVINHGGDGDDWSANNVITWGAGAIGFRKNIDESDKQLIDKLLNLENEIKIKRQELETKEAELSKFSEKYKI